MNPTTQEHREQLKDALDKYADLLVEHGPGSQNAEVFYIRYRNDSRFKEQADRLRKTVQRVYDELS